MKKREEKKSLQEIAIQGEPILNLQEVILQGAKGERISCSGTGKNDGEFTGAGGNLRITVDECGGALVLSVEAGLDGVLPLFSRQPAFSAESAVSLRFSPGTGMAKAEGCLAVYQHKDWWLRPEFTDAFDAIPGRTQLLIWKAGKKWFALAGVSTDFRTDIQPAADGLRVEITPGGIPVRRLQGILCSVSAGEDPYRCCEAAVWGALKRKEQTHKLRCNKRLPEMFRYLGWCSWDAFYHKVNQSGIDEKLAEFKEKKIPVRWLLVDDGWLDADYEIQHLKGLDADREKFPLGLGAAVDKWKFQDVPYPVEYVGVWHAVMGYWNGVAADAPAQRAFGTTISAGTEGNYLPLTDAGGAFAFWDIWHTYLQEQCGIDFVKVDGQSSIGLYHGRSKGLTGTSEALLKGLEGSAGVHFDGRLINCMGMAPQELWNRHSSTVSRSSDDFVPREQGSFGEHLLQNAYNSMLSGQFYWGDWDMFWSRHEDAERSAMLRAVSGGPVYTSDPVGATEVKYISPLILEDGRVLMGDEAGRPTVDCLLHNPVAEQGIVKLFNKVKDSFIIAAFSFSDRDEALTIRKTDLPGLGSRDWLVYSWTEREAAMLGDAGELELRLKAGRSEVYSLLPAGKAEDVIIIGDPLRYLAAACVKEVYQAGQNRWTVRLESPGHLCFYATQEADITGVPKCRHKVKTICGGYLYLVEGIRAERFEIVLKGRLDHK